MANNRVVAFSLFNTDADADAPLGEGVFGEISRIAGGAIEMGAVDGYGPAGADRYWNHTFSITDLTFDVHDASNQVERLAGQDVTLDLFISWRNPSGALVTQKRQYSGFLSGADQTFDRTTDSPRNYTFIPYRRIDGGGTNYQILTTSGANLYANTRTGELFVAGTDQRAAIRTAHGVA